MPVEVVDQYLVLIALTFLFTVLAVVLDEDTVKQVILQYFAAFLWLMSAFAHFIVGDTSSILTYAVAFLFAGFAFVFIGVAFYNTFMIIRSRRPPQI